MHAWKARVFHKADALGVNVTQSESVAVDERKTDFYFGQLSLLIYLVSIISKQLQLSK